MRTYLQFIAAISLFLLFAFCSGCIKNHYEKFYTGEEDSASKRSSSNTPVELRYSLANEESVAENEFLDIIESGYDFLGSSQFVATHCPWSCAIDHAKEIGATLVVLREVFSEKEVRTGVMVLPSTSYFQGSWDTYSSGYLYTPQNSTYSFRGNTYGNYSGTITTYNTVPYNYTVSVYDQSALFFKKRPIDENFYGALINIPVFLPGDKDSDPLELKVFAVLRDSQAWKDGIRRGDIVECINGIPIKQRGDIRRFSETGKPISLLTIRTEKK